MDSSVTVSTLQNNKDSVLIDSIYINHFINISNNGKTITFNMDGTDPMVYTLSDSSLSPYTHNIGGCGIPTGNTSISLSPNNSFLKIYGFVGYYIGYNYLFGFTTTYLHRI